mmetsp:Transcript_36012/g.64388  ORF Transcript_36012/g.64388 Transcript_36012/m.64388 type:complete len:225 (-) Transcript_36012:846-1520(-)
MKNRIDRGRALGYRRGRLLLAELGLETAHRLEHVLALAEGRGANETLAAGAETRAGRGHEVALFQDLGEHVPRGAAREADPDVGRVGAAVDGEAQLLEAVLQNGRVLHVKGHQLVHRLAALGLQASEAALLHDVGGAVEAGAVDAVPVLDDGEAVRKGELLGDHGPAQSDAGEAGVLGEGASLQRHLVGAGDLKDGAGAVGVVDEEGVGGVVDDDGAVVLGKLD